MFDYQKVPYSCEIKYDYGPREAILVVHTFNEGYMALQSVFVGDMVLERAE